MDWITDTVFGYTVEKHEIPRSGGRPYIANDPPYNIIWHTTEGSTIAGALATLGHNGDPSTIVIGEGRIIQLRPLTAQAAALHDPMNAHAFQIEICGFSKTTPWLPDDDTVNALAAITAYLSQNFNVPLVAPYDWPDDCSDMPMPWAANNKRRNQAQDAYPDPQGVWMHLEIPNQGPTWHWDAGALQRSVILEKAKALLAE
jgi:hypothetical protein